MFISCFHSRSHSLFLALALSLIPSWFPLFSEKPGTLRKTAIFDVFFSFYSYLNNWDNRQWDLQSFIHSVIPVLIVYTYFFDSILMRPHREKINNYLQFQMRPRISIRGSVGPLVHQSVRHAFVKNKRNEHFRANYWLAKYLLTSLQDSLPIRPSVSPSMRLSCFQ